MSQRLVIRRVTFRKKTGKSRGKLVRRVVNGKVVSGRANRRKKGG